MPKLYRVYIEIEADEYLELAKIFHEIILNLSTYPPEKVLSHPRVIVEEPRKK